MYIYLANQDLLVLNKQGTDAHTFRQYVSLECNLNKEQFSNNFSSNIPYKVSSIYIFNNIK